jgi:hypothetical protein
VSGGSSNGPMGSDRGTGPIATSVSPDSTANQKNDLVVSMPGARARPGFGLHAAMEVTRRSFPLPELPVCAEDDDGAAEIQGRSAPWAVTDLA